MSKTTNNVSDEEQENIEFGITEKEILKRMKEETVSLEEFYKLAKKSFKFWGDKKDGGYQKFYGEKR